MDETFEQFAKKIAIELDGVATENKIRSAPGKWLEDCSASCAASIAYELQHSVEYNSYKAKYGLPGLPPHPNLSDSIEKKLADSIMSFTKKFPKQNISDMAISSKGILIVQKMLVDAVRYAKRRWHFEQLELWV